MVEDERYLMLNQIMAWKYWKPDFSLTGILVFQNAHAKFSILLSPLKGIYYMLWAHLAQRSMSAIFITWYPSLFLSSSVNCSETTVLNYLKLWTGVPKGIMHTIYVKIFVLSKYIAIKNHLFLHIKDIWILLQLEEHYKIFHCYF